MNEQEEPAPDTREPAFPWMRDGRENDERAETRSEIPEPEPGRDPDALAKHGDPSLSGRRRAQVAERVRDRSGLAWVPASELLRTSSIRAGDVIARGQERAHRAVRDGTARGLRTVATAARDRVRRLGAARPTGQSLDDSGRSAVTLTR